MCLQEMRAVTKSYNKADSKKESLKDSKTEYSVYHVKENLSPASQKALIAVLYKVHGYLKKCEEDSSEPEKKEFVISMREIKNAIQYNGDNLEQVQELLYELKEFKLEYFVLRKDGTRFKEVFPILTYLKIDETEFTYDINQVIKDKMLDRDAYYRFLLLVQNPVTNKYSNKYVRLLYNMCINYVNLETGVGSKSISIDALRFFLSLSESDYPEFKEFHRTLMKKIDLQINKLLKINFEFSSFNKMDKKVISTLLSYYDPNVIKMIQQYEHIHYSMEEFFEEPAMVINNPQMLDFIESNHLSLKIIAEKLKEAFEAGVPEENYEEFLLFIKIVCERNKVPKKSIANAFYENMVTDSNIQLFSQKIEGVKKKKSKFDQKLISLYIDREIDKAIPFLRERRHIFKELLNRYESNMTISVYKNSLTEEELFEARDIFKVMLPDIQKIDGFPVVTFADWKQDPENSHMFKILKEYVHTEDE